MSPPSPPDRRSGRSWLAAAIGACIAAAALLHDHLPSPVAVHWGGSGTPNGSASLVTAIAIPVAITAVLSLASFRAPHSVQRALNVFAATMLVLTVALVLWANWNRSNWRDAAHLHSPQLAALVLLPILVALTVTLFTGGRRPNATRSTLASGINWAAGIATALLGMFALVRVAGPAVGPALLLAVIAMVLVRAKRPASFQLHVDDATLTLELHGVDVLLCARRRVTVPLDAVRGIAVDDRSRIPRPGMRLPGTGIPGFVTAGSYGVHDERSFWDVRKGQTLIRIELDASLTEYCRIVLEVPDPQQFARRWRGQLGAWVPTQV